MKTRALVILTAALLVTAGLCQELEEPGDIIEDEDRARIESADFLRYDPEDGVYHLDGNVIFSHRNIRLYCDSAVYDYDGNHAKATGNPRVVDPETTVTGDVIEADFDSEIATVVGEVTVVTQKQLEEDEEHVARDASNDDAPPRDLGELHERKSTITCEKIVYEYAEDVDRITATGRVRAVQEGRTAYADKAVYEGIPELLTVTGNVRIITDRGDEFRCPKAVISIAENWIQAEQVTGVGRRRDRDEEPAEQPAPVEEPEAPADGADADSDGADDEVDG